MEQSQVLKKFYIHRDLKSNFLSVLSKSPSVKIASILIFALCVIKLIWLFSHGADFCDFQSPWYGSRVLLRGENPYKDYIIRVLHYEELSQTSPARVEPVRKDIIPSDSLTSFPLLYFPFYLAVLFPLALFSWKIGTILFVSISMLCLGLSLIILWHYMKSKTAGILLFVVLLGIFFFGEPVTEALMKGQSTLIVAFMLLLAVLDKFPPVIQIPALILGTVKPTLWPVIGIYWLTKKTIVSKYKRVMILSVFLCQILPLLLIREPFGEIVKSYVYLADTSFGPRAVNSISYPLANYNMTTLDVLWFRLFPEGSSMLALWITKGIVIGGLGVLSISFLRKNLSLCLLNFCCLQYLLFYQRRYDLPLLILMGFLAISGLEKRDLRRYIIFAGILILSIPHFWQEASWLEGASRSFLAGAVSVDIWLLLLVPLTNLLLSHRLAQ